MNFTGQNTITRDKREFLLRETTDDQRQSQAEICLPFNGTVFPDCFFFFCFCVITLVALANRGNRPRDRRFPRKLNISSVTWPHNFSLPHDARLSPRIIPRDTFDPVTFPSRYSRHEGSFFHSRTPNVPPPLSYPIVDHSWNATRSFPPCDYQLVIVQRSFTLTSERSLIRRL